MTDEEWYEFSTECGDMMYRHPSCAQVCMLREMDEPCGFKPFIPIYHTCEIIKCPKLNK